MSWINYLQKLFIHFYEYIYVHYLFTLLFMHQNIFIIYFYY